MRLHVLNTSLAPLNVAGEVVLSVPPLQLPPSEPLPLAALGVGALGLAVREARAGGGRRASS